jgi:hypothetical protein
MDGASTSAAIGCLGSRLTSNKARYEFSTAQKVPSRMETSSDSVRETKIAGLHNRDLIENLLETAAESRRRLSSGRECPHIKAFAVPW